MKIKIKFYEVTVQTPRDSAFVVCECYNLDIGEEFVAVEYYELITTFDNRGLSIPYNRQATFKEELRLLHQAASTYKGPRNTEKRHLEENLKNAYGPEITLTFKEVQPKVTSP